MSSVHRAHAEATAMLSAAPAAPARMTTWLDRFGLTAIVTGFVLLAFWYSLLIPPFETPDELYHYAFVRHLAQGNPLPVQADTSTGPWEQEGSQAPLYYWPAPIWATHSIRATRTGCSTVGRNTR
jgi:hypothetical protein